MGIFGTIGSSMLGRAGVGAAAGGLLGAANTGDVGGVLGGAAAGAGFGAGMRGLSGLAGKLGTVSGVAGRGLGGMRRANTFGFNQLQKLNSNRAVRGGLQGSLAAGRGMATAQNWIGNNAVAVNKWGGRGLAAAGFGSAAYMGSSMIGSNSGY